MQNKPKLRFKEFNDEWNIAKIQQLLDNRAIISHLDGNHGALYPRSQEFVSVGVPYITANDFSTGKVDTITCKKLTPERASQFKKGVAINGDVLFAHNATVGPVALLKTTESFVILSTTATYFRTNNSILLNTFLKTVLEAPYFVKQYTPIMKQTTRNQVPLLTQRKLNIAFPSIAEQKKIAEFLSKVDEVIAEREEEVKDLEKQKKGLMQKIFSQQLRFTDSNNNPYPDWEEKKIGDVFEFYNGKAHEQEIDENGEYIVVNSKFISTEGQVKKYTNKVICPLKKDDIVLVMSDVPNGKAMSKCYLIEEDNKYSLNQRICCLRTKDVARFFIYQISRNKYFLKFDNGVSQTNLRKEDVLKCPIQVPCLEEQQKIANVLSKLDELIEEKKALLSDWQQFKKGLLQQMFV